MCNISTIYDKVKVDGPTLPKWPCVLLLASVVFMHAKPGWKQKLYSLCCYTSMGLQGHRVTLRGHRGFCLQLKLLSEKHLFLIKWGLGASWQCNRSSLIVDEQSTPVWILFALRCRGEMFFLVVSLPKLIKLLYIIFFLGIIPLAVFLSLKSNKYSSYWIWLLDISFVTFIWSFWFLNSEQHWI